MLVHRKLTLGPHQHQREVAGAPIVGHSTVVVVDSLEAYLVLQAEDKYDRIHPHGELRREKGRARKLREAQEEGDTRASWNHLQSTLRYAKKVIFRVYYRKDIEEKFHFGQNTRIFVCSMWGCENSSYGLCNKSTQKRLLFFIQFFGAED
jgi:hypothetical protein